MLITISKVNLCSIIQIQREHVDVVKASMYDGIIDGLNKVNLSLL